MTFSCSPLPKEISCTPHERYGQKPWTKSSERGKKFLPDFAFARLIISSGTGNSIPRLQPRSSVTLLPRQPHRPRRVQSDFKNRKTLRTLRVSCSRRCEY